VRQNEADGEGAHDAGEEIVDRVAFGDRFRKVAIEPADQIRARLIGVATITKRMPRNINLPAACGSPGETNCGRKVTKNTMIFGLSRLMARPFR
jgi:hypothetical protein